jgi:hypothetical protein
MPTGVALKQFISKITGIRQSELSAEKSSGKGGWSGVRIRPSNRNSPTYQRDPLKYDKTFPLLLRQRCLRAVYPEPQFADTVERGSGGNIDSVSISMREAEWQKVMSQYEQDEANMRASTEAEYAEEVAAGQHDAFDR